MPIFCVYFYTSSRRRSFATATPACLRLFKSARGQHIIKALVNEDTLLRTHCRQQCVRNNVSLFARALMPHSCIAGGCFNSRKDGVSPHKCTEDAHFAKLWKNAVKNTHCDVFNPLISQLCNANFIEDSFEEQSVIAKSLG